MGDEPLVWTKYGHLPAFALVHECEWVDTPDYTMVKPTWYLDGELVKQDCHVLHRKSIFSDAVAGNLGG